MPAIAVSDHIHWIGVKDPGLRVFDIVMATQYGTTYNAYVVVGQTAAVIDTVKAGFTNEFLDNLTQVVPLSRISHLVVNHTEPDHSGAITELLKLRPDIEIICAAPALPFVKSTINVEAKITAIKDDYRIDLVGRSLVFKMTPYMHWPDTMMEYCPEDKVLFSCDGFAAHLCEDSIFADQAKGDLPFEFRYYYDAIMRPFAGYIRRNLPKLDPLDIQAICPSHGPIFRKDPRRWIDLYKKWTADQVGDKTRVALFYASNYGNTKTMADRLGARLTSAGIETEMRDMTAVTADETRDLMERASAILIGTPTFNGDAPKPVWDTLGCVSTIYAIGKKAAVFGSYGWGGEGAKLVAERLAGLKLKVYGEQFRARLVPSDDELRQLDEYADGLIAFLKGA